MCLIYFYVLDTFHIAWFVRNCTVFVWLHYTTMYVLNRHQLLLSVIGQDPEASYDVNDDDSDPQPRYEYTNENRWVIVSLCWPCVGSGAL